MVRKLTCQLQSNKMTSKLFRIYISVQKVDRCLLTSGPSPINSWLRIPSSLTINDRTLLIKDSCVFRNYCPCWRHYKLETKLVFVSFSKLRVGISGWSFSSCQKVLNFYEKTASRYVPTWLIYQ